jgi:hypothetical protein
MYGLYICIVIMSTILTGLHAHDRDAALNIKRGVVRKDEEGKRRPRHERLFLAPWKLFRTMLYDPLCSLDSKSFQAAYEIDIAQNYNFFLVTVSRLFYYCGVSSKKIALVLECDLPQNFMVSHTFVDFFFSFVSPVRLFSFNSIS